MFLKDMEIKKSLILLTMLALTAPGRLLAQSCDARYPMGMWQTTMEGDKDPVLFVNMMIDRDPDKATGVCGGIDITEYATDKTIFAGSLTYAGKEMKDNMPTGTYYFKVKSEKGETCTISVNGSRDPVVIGTGVLKDHPAFKLDIVHCPGAMVGSGGGQYAQYCKTEEDLLDDLQLYLKDSRIPVVGFGNVRQYVAAHAKLDPSKPKYAKPKGTGAINIRATGKATAAKVGELRPGETLLVTEEFNGWCQVATADGKSGWVSLSVVTLTNTPGRAVAATATATATSGTGSAAVDCPLTGDWHGYLGSGGWGECALFLQAKKQVGMTSGMAKQAGHGNLSLTDEEFVRERKYNLLFVRPTDSNTFEFTVQLMAGKQLKQGKLQIKRSGSTLTMTGLDAWARQQPFHGKTMEKNQ